MRCLLLALQLLLLNQIGWALSNHGVFGSQRSAVAGHEKVDDKVVLVRRTGSPKRKASPSPVSAPPNKQQRPNSPNVREKSPSTTLSDPINPALGRASSSSTQGIETPGQQVTAASPHRRGSQPRDSEVKSARVKATSPRNRPPSTAQHREAEKVRLRQYRARQAAQQGQSPERISKILEGKGKRGRRLGSVDSRPSGSAGVHSLGSSGIHPLGSAGLHPPGSGGIRLSGSVGTGPPTIEQTGADPRNEKRRQKAQNMTPEEKADFNARRRVRDKANRDKKKLQQQAAAGAGGGGTAGAFGGPVIPQSSVVPSLSPVRTTQRMDTSIGLGASAPPRITTDPRQWEQRFASHSYKGKEQREHEQAVAGLRKSEQRILAVNKGGRLTRSMVTPEMAKVINEPSSPSSSSGRSSTPEIKDQPQAKDPVQRGNPTRMGPPPPRPVGTSNLPIKSAGQNPAPNTQNRGQQPMNNAPGQLRGPFMAPQSQGNAQTRASGPHIPGQAPGAPGNALSQVLNMNAPAQNPGASNQPLSAVGRVSSGVFMYRPSQLPIPAPNPQMGAPALPAHLPINHMDPDALRPIPLEQPMPNPRPSLRPPSLPTGLPTNTAVNLANLRSATISPPPLDVLLSEHTPWG